MDRTRSEIVQLHNWAPHVPCVLHAVFLGNTLHTYSLHFTKPASRYTLSLVQAAKSKAFRRLHQNITTESSVLFLGSSTRTCNFHVTLFHKNLIISMQVGDKY